MRFKTLNESFDSMFKTLTEDSIIEQLEECLNRLNEATISDEDQRDSDLIRSMLDKMKSRSNAKFTPEEKAVLDKYGITRNNDFKNLFVDDRPLDRNVDSKSTSYRYSKNHSNGTKSKINYADRARKSRERDKTQVFPGWGRVKNDEINAHGGGMSSIDTLQDAHNIAQEVEMRDKISTMKNNIWNRDFHKEYVDNADAAYDKEVADAKASYEKRLADAERARDSAKTGWHKQGLDRAQGEIDKMLKRTPKTESKSMNEAPVYDMSPQYDARQSFYGKARVDDNGNEKTLYSYNTPVAKIIGNKVELLPKWDWSQTTLRHVKEFLKQNGFEANSLAQMKKDYL
jgi:hypothetical protein